MRKPIRVNVRQVNEENNSENISIKSKKVNNRKFTIKKDTLKCQ